MTKRFARTARVLLCPASSLGVLATVSRATLCLAQLASGGSAQWLACHFSRSPDRVSAGDTADLTQRLPGRARSALECGGTRGIRTFYLQRVSSTTPTGGSASQHSIRRFPRFLASRACPHRAETPSLGTRSAVVAGASAPLHEFDRPLLVLGLLEVESRQRGCVDLIDGALDSFRLALEHFCRHQRRRAQAAHVPR